MVGCRVGSRESYALYPRCFRMPDQGVEHEIQKEVIHVNDDEDWAQNRIVEASSDEEVDRLVSEDDDEDLYSM